MSRKPIPHGLNLEGFLTEKQCKQLKIPATFVNFNYQKWCSIEDLVEVSQKNDSSVSAASARNEIQRTFQKIYDGNPASPSMQAYCASCKSFLQNNKALFNRKYEKAHLIKKAKEIGYDNVLKETIIGLGKRSRELDVQLKKNDNSEASSSKKVKSTQQEPDLSEDEQEQLPLSDMNEREAYEKIVLTLYKSAKDIVLKRQNAKNMSIYEYKIMTSGFSGILDLVDKSNESGQAQFFTREFFEKWSNHLFNKHQIKINNKEGDHQQSFITWRVVAGLCKRDNSGDAAIRYIAEMKQKKQLSKFNRKILSLFEHIVETVEDQNYLFDNNSPIDKTELDYLNRIWTKVFDYFLTASGLRHSIRLLTVDYSGESVSRHTSITKKNMYPDKKNTVSFKIDCRFVYDYNGQEYDLGVGELSKQNPGDDKLFGDEGKLIREGKEVVDGLASTLCGRSSDQEFKGWLLQLNGHNGELITIHMISPGLYVSIPQRSLTIPSSLTTLIDFEQTLDSLFLLKDGLEANAHLVHESIMDISNRRTSTSERMGREQETSSHCTKVSWIRPTYFTPPGDLLQMIDPELFTYELFPELPTTSENNEQGAKDNDQDEATRSADENGWIRLTTGKWHNVYSKDTVAYDPYE
ncbi:hypothetical protein INT45_009765 [Circinella minor]|uniref:Uncharacterized protein n=1 Tax=Circinella minor TaxID=1195481 RepID=A0A8H7RID6_9FUNG|nr:hypothetical protein INT45_009765 [Circinella minor]